MKEGGDLKEAFEGRKKLYTNIGSKASAQCGPGDKCNVIRDTRAQGEIRGFVINPPSFRYHKLCLSRKDYAYTSR